MFDWLINFITIYSFLIHQPLKKNSFENVYIKISGGGFYSDIKAKNETLDKKKLPVSQNTVAITFFSDNFYLGLSTKNYASFGESSGVNFAYSIPFKNETSIRLNLFYGKGRYKLSNEVNSSGDIAFMDITSKYIAAQDKSISTSAPSIFFITSNFESFRSYHNFYEITPSISYEFPIFKEHGYHLVTEVFYSHKSFSNINKLEFYDTKLFYANEFGFQLGISRHK